MFKTYIISYIYILYKVRIGEKRMHITRFLRSAPLQSYILIFVDAIAMGVIVYGCLYA